MKEVYRDDFTQKAGKFGALHGDVGIFRIPNLPEDLKEVDGNIIAEGEATGHHHYMDGDVQLLEDKDENLFMELFGNNCKVKHQEHGTIELDKGYYQIVRQVEYDEGKTRRVYD